MNLSILAQLVHCSWQKHNTNMLLSHGFLLDLHLYHVMCNFAKMMYHYVS